MLIDMTLQYCDLSDQLAEAASLRITPIAASRFWPVVPHGQRFYEPLGKRFKADHPLMLTLTHHLFFKQGCELAEVSAACYEAI